MADKKISALTSLGSAVAGVDLLHIIDNSSTPINKNISITDLFQNIPIPVALGGTEQNIAASIDVNITTSITTLDGAAFNASHTGALTATGVKDGQIKIITMNTAPSNTSSSDDNILALKYSRVAKELDDVTKDNVSR